MTSADRKAKRSRSIGRGGVRHAIRRLTTEVLLERWSLSSAPCSFGTTLPPKLTVGFKGDCRFF